MSCFKRGDRTEHYSCNGCCASNSSTERKSCAVLDPEIHLCLCQNDGGCSGCCAPINCNSCRFVDDNTEYCQCAEEMMWNNSTPPKPNCKWLHNFCELRRQWSDHARQQNCKCCNCKPRSNVNLINIKDNIQKTSRHMQTYSDTWDNKPADYSFFSYIGSIGYSSLVPGPTALISFVLLIFTALGFSSGFSVYRYHSFSKICLRYSN